MGWLKYINPLIKNNKLKIYNIMAGCPTITFLGVPLDCGSFSGLKKIYISPIANVTSVELDATRDNLASITMDSTNKFKEFSFRRGNASFNETGNNNAGVPYIDTTVDMQFNKKETIKRVEMMKLISAPSYVIALDQNDIYWFLGYGSYFEQTVTSETGANAGEFNGYKLSMVAQTNELGVEVSKTIVDGVI